MESRRNGPQLSSRHDDDDDDDIQVYGTILSVNANATSVCSFMFRAGTE